MSGKGEAAKRVYDIMKQIMHREDVEEKAQERNKTDSQPREAIRVRAQINKLILIDRFAILFFGSDRSSRIQGVLILVHSSIHIKRIESSEPKN